jgi:Flp pilus assembly protein TadG
MKERKNILKSSSGATAVEFALVAFPLFVLLMGIIEYSLIYFASSVIENATNVGSRLAITGNLNSGDTRVAQGETRSEMIRNNIIRRASGLLDESKLSITCTNLGSNFNGIPSNAFGSHSCGAPVDTSSCDETQSGNNNPGQGGQIVVYNVAYCWNIITPLGGLINGMINSQSNFPEQILLQSSLVVQNENFPVTPPSGN